MRAVNRGGLPIVERIPKIDVRWKPKGTRFAPPLPAMEERFPFEFEGTQYVAVMVWEAVGGGYRRWFRCEGCQRRRATLFMHRRRLACRVCHRLGYLTQRVTRADRLRLRYSRFARRHGLSTEDGETGWNLLLPPRDIRRKGQHQATTFRQYERAEALHMAYFAAWEQSNTGRWTARMLARDGFRWTPGA